MLGVCSGLAVHLGVPVGAVRWAVVASSAFFGAGTILYLWLGATVPLDDLSSEQAGAPDGRLRAPLPKATKDRAGQAVGPQLLIAGGVLLVLAAAMLAGEALFGWGILPVAAGAAVAGGLVLLWGQVSNLTTWRSPRAWAVRIAGVALLLGGVFLLLSQQYAPGTLAVGGLIGVLIAAALAVALLPVWVALFSSMTKSRTREAREAERADIAAHLHDSVLQTLTLIRAAASDPQQVRALALTQERELRSWLYTGRDTPGSSAAQLLRERVASLEAAHGVEVSFVAVGDAAPGPTELAAVAAAAEAVQNALRHGAPPISVYMEATPNQVEVFVKDAGPGFDVAEVPPDRHGIRESIVGRVERVGGSAKIKTARPSARGTEVQIGVPRTGA